MSNDIEDSLSNPASLIFHQENPIDQKTHYRLMDPPINCLVTDVVRIITRTPQITNDWDWTKSWQMNQLASNIPSQQAILIGRLSMLIFFPFTCFFIYRIGNSLINHWGGMLALLFFGLNPLILLHTRRAMVEGIFLFFVCLLIMLIVSKKKYPLWVPVILALAINSKQTAVLLIPMIILYYFWMNHHENKIQWLKTALAFTLIPVAITFLLNPVAWAEPLNTIKTAVKERAALIQGNNDLMQYYYPERVSQSKFERFLTINYHTFYEPLALDDIANYRAEQQESFDQYTRIPIHTAFRSYVFGTIQIIVLISAVLLQLLQWIKAGKQLPPDLPQWFFFYSGLLASYIGLSMLSSIYQRYVLILLPFTCILFAWIMIKFIQQWNKKPAEAGLINQGISIL